MEPFASTARKVSTWIIIWLSESHHITVKEASYLKFIELLRGSTFLLCNDLTDTGIDAAKQNMTVDVVIRMQCKDPRPPAAPTMR